MKIIACLLFLAIVAELTAGELQKPAPQFSSDVVVWNKRVDSEANSVFLLVPEKKSYVESTKLAADFSHGASIFRPRDPSNPCAEWIELDRDLPLFHRDVCHHFRAAVTCLQKSAFGGSH